MTIFAFLDDWDIGERDKPIRAEPDAIEATIREVVGRESADLFLLRDTHDIGAARAWLAVTTSMGRFSVGAQVDEGVFASLVGDATLDGEVPFAHGGQMTTWERRFCVEETDAIAAAKHYVTTEELLDPTRRWIQGADKPGL